MRLIPKRLRGDSLGTVPKLSINGGLSVRTGDKSRRESPNRSMQEETKSMSNSRYRSLKPLGGEIAESPFPDHETKR